MFKRSTKLTALLVAAASVASTVPAMAATKLATKDGNIDSAVAFGNGTYIYEGYRTDDDDNGLYINTGDKDKMLDDVDELGVKFGDKYVSAMDGDDPYVIDLSTGKVSDEDTLEDLIKTAATKLDNKLSKTERYEGIEIDEADLTQRGKGRFADVYYSYYKSGTNDAPENFNKFGYTNDSGKYIDCSYDLNIYAYSTSGSGSEGKMYKIEDIEDEADVTETDKIKVTDVDFVKYIGQDEKYIYSIIKVTLDGALTVKDETASEVHYYVQKVSKEQGDKQDDAYLPKTTESYEIAPEAVLGNGDVKDAYQVLMADTNVGTEKDNQQIKYAVVDGVIYAVANDSDDKVKVYKILLKTSEKLDRKDKNGKVGAHVAKKDDDCDTDIIGKGAWSIDINGNVWALDKGEILKSAKCGDFEKVYTCDRSLNRIDVYDENNLIAWDSNGDVYTTVTEGSEAAKEEAKEIIGETVTTEPTEPAVTVKTGWDQLADGTWNLYDATGKKVTGWANVGGVWYYMDPITAVMKTGWLNDNGTWYYLQSSGAMKTGWFQDTDGRWYYLNANGSMAANTTVDGYVLGANGAWIK